MGVVNQVPLYLKYLCGVVNQVPLCCDGHICQGNVCCSADHLIIKTRVGMRTTRNVDWQSYSARSVKKGQKIELKNIDNV